MATITAVRSGNWSDTSHVTAVAGFDAHHETGRRDDTVQAGDAWSKLTKMCTLPWEATGSGYFAVSNVYPAPQRPNITAAIVNNADGEWDAANHRRRHNRRHHRRSDSRKRQWHAVYNGGGTIGNITGDLTAGNANGAWAVYNNGGTIGDITGDLTAGDANSALGGVQRRHNRHITGDRQPERQWRQLRCTTTAAQSATSPGDPTAGDAVMAHGRCTTTAATIGDITGDMTAGNANGAWAAVQQRRHNRRHHRRSDSRRRRGAWAVYNNGGTIGDIDGSLICGATGQFPIFGPFRLVANPAKA